MKTVAVALSWDLWQALAFLRVHVIVISALVLSLFFLFFILRNFAVTLFYVSSLTTPSVSFPLAYVEPNSRHSLAVNNATRCSAVFLRPFNILCFLSQSLVHSLSPANKTQSLLKWLQSLGTNKCAHYTGLFEMIVGVLTTCHTQYTWDSSICILLFNRTTLQVSVTFLTGALYVHPLWFYKHQHDKSSSFQTVCSMSAVMVSTAVLIRTFSCGILAGRGGT